MAEKVQIESFEEDTQEDEEALNTELNGFAPAGIDVEYSGISSTFHSPVPKDFHSGEPCILGVDEAGRGPVLGSMVYALSYCLKSYSANLKLLGFADSKTLTHETRVRLFKQVCNVECEEDELFRNVGWSTRIMTARDISSEMLRLKSRVTNLNEQAHDATIALIRGVLDSGVNVNEIYVDTVGSPQSYQAKLQRQFPTTKVTVTKKADSLFPIVSVASICAKVTRDFSLMRLDESGGTWGSGYPSDARTSTWIKSNIHPVFGWSEIVRFSWQTARDLLDKNKDVVKVIWHDPVEISAFLSKFSHWPGKLVTNEF
ncbi:ribonuclease HII-domain-containing protein [Lipomyces arxii]|uniref:ribonuclease HII-domain-containing protein n=1 Tax=Lipomyces arxii TaxID=56418 RepID=UPI0034CE70BF